MIELIKYHPQYLAAFREMNLQWLNEFGLTESHDLEVLDDPQKFIIDKGGALYLAVSGGQLAGSAAMVPEDEHTMELAKMCVHPDFRGQGISLRLMNQCLQFAKDRKIARIILYSNHQLQQAIRIYEKFGFRHVPVHDSPFVTADVKMELIIDEKSDF